MELIGFGALRIYSAKRVWVNEAEETQFSDCTQQDSSGE